MTYLFNEYYAGTISFTMISFFFFGYLYIISRDKSYINDYYESNVYYNKLKNEDIIITNSNREDEFDFYLNIYSKARIKQEEFCGDLFSRNLSKEVIFDNNKNKFKVLFKSTLDELDDISYKLYSKVIIIYRDYDDLNKTKKELLQESNKIKKEYNLI